MPMNTPLLDAHSDLMNAIAVNPIFTREIGNLKL